ncbi:Proteasomal ATPase-associated factor 1 [Borealophlyctis nickersoniae]|nr:Proteasomal ATPase-associated factor 1 [Borealophlyctis nickersoniae]
MTVAWSPISIPHITVQPDFPLDIGDVAAGKVPSASFWLSLYNHDGRPSNHIKVSVRRGAQGSMCLDAGDSAKVEFINGHSFALLNADGSRTIIRAPDLSFNVRQKINVLASSPGGELVVVGGDDGFLKIMDRGDGSVRRDLIGHVGDLTTVRFFPSGQVILSGATDMQLKIWGIDGSNPVTLKGHTRGICDSGIIDRGRNVVSCAKDGQVRLWESATGETIAIIGSESESLSAMSLGELSEGANDSTEGDREVGTSGKVLFVATDKGRVLGYNLGTKQQVLSLQSISKSPLTALHFEGHRKLLVIGSRDGLVELYDSKNTGTPIAAFRRNRAAICAVRILPAPTGDTVHLICVTAEGSCFECRVNQLESKIGGQLPTPHVTTEYVGADVEPLFGLDICGSQIMTGGREGVVRLYL